MECDHKGTAAISDIMRALENTLNLVELVGHSRL